MAIKRTDVVTTLVQLLKYGIIGVGNTIITMVVFYLMNTKLGISYGLSNITGYVLGLMNSFVWNRTWVFKAKDNIWREASLFVVGFVICMSLQLLVSWCLLEGLGWKNLPDDVIPWFPMAKAGQNIVMILAMVCYTIANYIYNRFVTFRVKNVSKEDSEPNSQK